jgi:hypothetical protein
MWMKKALTSFEAVGEGRRANGSLTHGFVMIFEDNSIPEGFGRWLLGYLT